MADGSRWLRARRLRREPASAVYGYDRGRPIDRHYIEGFLDRHSIAIRGRVLEVGDDQYTRRFGGSRVGRSDVLDVRLDAVGATITGDIADLSHVASESFDAIVFTQTLQCVYEPRAAVATLHRLLAPGGVLLATFPGTTHLPPGGGWTETWYWSFTPLAARRLFEERFGSGNVVVEPRGNLAAATAFLQSLAVEDLRRRDLDRDDGAYPLVITSIAVKPPAADAPGQDDRVAVVIPCYNQGRFLGEAIDSVLAQRHRRLEVIVVDDGSTDDTARVAAKYSSVRYVRQANAGPSAARNRGVQETTSEYLLFLDADDRLLDRAVETLLAWLRPRPDCAFVSGDHRYIDVDGRVVEEWSRPVVESDHYRRLLEGNYVGMLGTVLFRRAAFEIAGGFDTTLPSCEDYEIFLRFARRFPVVNVAATIAEYRRYGGSRSEDGVRMLRGAVATLRSQAPFVRGHAGLEAACASGLAYCRKYHGGALARQIHERWRAGASLRQLAGSVATLVRHAAGEAAGPFGRRAR